MPAAPGATLLMSDVHARYEVVDAQLAHASQTLGRPVDRIIVLGDFGFFGPNLHDHFRRKGRRFGCPVLFIEGNHEDFIAFDRLVRDYADVVTHLPRNTIQDIAGLRWLCIGGARYMDAWSTPCGCEITEQDIAACLAHPPGSIDVVISHDCPAGIGMTNSDDLDHLGPPGIEEFLALAEHLQPKWWFFGHHHRWHDRQAGSTRFLGLPQSWQGYVILDGDGGMERVENEVPLPGRPRWWRWLGMS